jgi:hypothetical protein
MIIETISTEIKGPIIPSRVGTAESLALKCKRHIMIAAIMKTKKKGIGIKFREMLALLIPDIEMLEFELLLVLLITMVSHVLLIEL